MLFGETGRLELDGEVAYRTALWEEVGDRMPEDLTGGEIMVDLATEAFSTMFFF